MFGSKKKGDTINTSMINTIIGHNSKIEGVLTASESTRIDGVLEGKIVSESAVIVGETGEVVGDITAVEILIAGIVYGNLVARERIEMTSTGRVLGDLITKTLVIDEGASFKGNCTMEVDGEEKMIAPPDTKNIHTDQAAAAVEPVEEPQPQQDTPHRENRGKDRSGRGKKDDGRGRHEADEQEGEA